MRCRTRLRDRVREEPEYPDNVTFGCRIGHIPSQTEPACSLVSAGAARSDQRLFGQKLDRDQAPNHPRLTEFWTVVDCLILNDPLLHEHLFHMPTARRRARICPFVAAS